MKEKNEISREVKRIISRLNKKKQRNIVICSSVVVILALVGLAVFFICRKRRQKEDYWEYDDEYDDLADENGCRYTGDEDFEDAKILKF